MGRPGGAGFACSHHGQFLDPGRAGRRRRSGRGGGGGGRAAVGCTRLLGRLRRRRCGGGRCRLRGGGVTHAVSAGAPVEPGLNAGISRGVARVVGAPASAVAGGSGTARAISEPGATVANTNISPVVTRTLMASRYSFQADRERS